LIFQLSFIPVPLFLFYRKQADTSSSGQIIYEAEHPDWEDEDPDDDLEL